MMHFGVFLLLACACLQASANYKTEMEKRGTCPMHYVTGPGDVCFRFSEDKKPFEAARKQCESEGAQLVNDQSEAVYRFVQQHLEANPSRPKITWIFGKVNKAFTKWHYGYWVGARKTGGSFRWLDGTPVYDHWLRGMPDNGRLFLINWVNENCVQQLESWNGWNDAPCNKHYRYVCQRGPMDPCNEVNCGKHGHCVERKSKAACVCHEGWGGSRCEKSLDVCVPNPCRNGGKCYKNWQGAHCQCVGRFSGRRCEKECRFVVTSEGMPAHVDALILLDGSTSVSAPDFKKSLNFVAKFVGKLDVGAAKARVGLIQFSHTWKKEFGFRDSVSWGKNGVKNKITSVAQLTGGTATGRVLEAARDVFANEQSTFAVKMPEKYIIVVTDGQSHQEAIIRETVPQILKMGVHVLAVGIGDAVDEKELLLITGGHHERVFSVDSFDQLNAEFLEKIIEKMCD